MNSLKLTKNQHYLRIKETASYSTYEKPFNEFGNKESKVIALEGLIGIGKSTLCHSLKQEFPDEVDVYREESNEKMLQLFYTDPSKYGFCLQWGMLKSRIYQLKLAQHDKRYGRYPHRDMYFWDRSMVGDYIFALWNHLQGSISKAEMETYESEFGGSFKEMQSLPFLKDIDLFVLLNDEPINCKYRIEHCRGNKSEQGIPISYYEGLDDIHFHIFLSIMKSKMSKVLVQQWGDFQNASSAKRIYADITNNVIEVPSIYHEKKVDKVVDSLVYEGPECIMAAYEEVSKDKYSIGSIKDVYIPYNIMTVTPEQKNVDKELCEEYGITFYQNEFKRVLLWHLSKHHNVHLYQK